MAFSELRFKEKTENILKPPYGRSFVFVHSKAEENKMFAFLRDKGIEFYTEASQRSTLIRYNNKNW